MAPQQGVRETRCEISQGIAYRTFKGWTPNQWESVIGCGFFGGLRHQPKGVTRAAPAAVHTERGGSSGRESADRGGLPGGFRGTTGYSFDASVCAVRSFRHSDDCTTTGPSGAIQRRRLVGNSESRLVRASGISVSRALVARSSCSTSLMVEGGHRRVGVCLRVVGTDRCTGPSRIPPLPIARVATGWSPARSTTSNRSAGGCRTVTPESRPARQRRPLHR